MLTMFKGGFTTEIFLYKNRLSGALPAIPNPSADACDFAVNFCRSRVHTDIANGYLSIGSWLLSSNRISGSIPFEYFDKANINRFDMAFNRLSGVAKPGKYKSGFAAGKAHWPNVALLSLTSNRGLKFDLSNLAYWPSLKVLLIQDTQTGGTLPDQSMCTVSVCLKSDGKCTVLSECAKMKNIAPQDYPTKCLDRVERSKKCKLQSVVLRSIPGPSHGISGTMSGGFFSRATTLKTLDLSVNRCVCRRSMCAGADVCVG